MTECNRCGGDNAVREWGICPDCFEEECEGIADDVTGSDDGSDMTFDEYQEACNETARGFADPDVVSEYDRKVKAMFLALALNGEAGEFAEKVKKYVREDDVTYLVEAEDELGDVLWYWNQFASLIDTHASAIAENNIDKLLDREQRDEIFGQGDDR